MNQAELTATTSVRATLSFAPLDEGLLYGDFSGEFSRPAPYQPGVTSFLADPIAAPSFSTAETEEISSKEKWVRDRELPKYYCYLGCACGFIGATNSVQLCCCASYTTNHCCCGAIE